MSAEHRFPSPTPLNDDTPLAVYLLHDVMREILVRVCMVARVEKQFDVTGEITVRKVRKIKNKGKQRRRSAEC